MSHQVGHRGPRPGRTAPGEGYRNAPMGRQLALDVAIEFGRITETRAELRPRGEGYDLAVPAEAIGFLIATVLRQADAIAAVGALADLPAPPEGAPDADDEEDDPDNPDEDTDR